MCGCEQMRAAYIDFLFCASIQILRVMQMIIERTERLSACVCHRCGLCACAWRVYTCLHATQTQTV